MSLNNTRFLIDNAIIMYILSLFIIGNSPTLLSIMKAVISLILLIHNDTGLWLGWAWLVDIRYEEIIILIPLSMLIYLINDLLFIFCFLLLLFLIRIVFG